MRSLDQLATDARAAFPAAGARVEKAVALLLAGDVTYNGTRQGRDAYTIGKYQGVSTTDRRCPCADRRAQTRDGKICKHVLAAMLYHRLYVRQNDAAERLLALLRAHAGARLQLRYEYLASGHEQRKELIGYHVLGESPVRLAPAERIAFANADLRIALRATGRGLESMPRKGRWYEYDVWTQESAASDEPLLEASDPVINFIGQNESQRRKAYNQHLIEEYGAGQPVAA